MIYVNGYVKQVIYVIQVVRVWVVVFKRNGVLDYCVVRDGVVCRLGKVCVNVNGLQDLIGDQFVCIEVFVDILSVDGLIGMGFDGFVFQGYQSIIGGLFLVFGYYQINICHGLCDGVGIDELFSDCIFEQNDGVDVGFLQGGQDLVLFLECF